MKTLVVTLEKNEIVVTIFENENNDEYAKNDIAERCKNSNVYMKLNIDGFSYVQYRKISPAEKAFRASQYKAHIKAKKI